MFAVNWDELNMPNTIGERVAAERKKLGLTQTALAEKVGVTQQAIGNIENNRSDSKRLADIAEALGVTYTYLKTGNNTTIANHLSVVNDTNVNYNINSTATYDEIKDIVPSALDRTIVAITKRLNATGGGKLDIIEHRDLIGRFLAISIVGELSNDYSAMAEGLELLSEIK
ncbi:helix-turn-helix domain-containing protein [Pseudoalteromonas tunicata]|uniref:HTH cro/C1-type domain-containing protein n=1 Tax=Pseudoalteromonas tunicata D2 TaxID=87626 RepID=A4C8R2_9GAMM|nr:helix-turn-helix transcriptional regulator [Pseudoalteromonas tunicata]ATC93480.1 hypothetical protein PTUN_a0731 [Pseudoalteromonas tunicata]AXT32520.1 XRE family transcriptional regulator [Pseudoalteromonas tunicata]EAR28977.1 hypothetical protein PTD2_08034 [Pseudoalteromonas tunicata D2]